MAESMLGNTQNSNGNERLQGSPPSVIANAILQAIKADRPRTRYVAGAMAKPLIAMRKYLGDRVFDSLLERMM